MDIKGVQSLLTAAGYYKGDISGVIGPQTVQAVERLLGSRRDEIGAGWTTWATPRQVIAAGQLVLNHAGFEAGRVDGLVGHNTREAFGAWQAEQSSGKRPEEVRTPLPHKPKSPTVMFPRQADCPKFYGEPGTPGLVNQLAMFDLPLPMRIDYDLSHKSTRVQLHRKCGKSAIWAMEQVVRHYGEKRWRELGLDRNAGTYNPRRMRNGTSWSMHAYGCAWDFYAEPNGLNVRAPKALFSGPEYRAFFDIWEANGWTSLGRAIGRDWMHVQAARL